MAGAGDAWDGRVLHQAGSSDDSSSYFLLRKLQKDRQAREPSVLTLGEPWTSMLSLSCQSLEGFKDKEKTCMKEPDN